MADIYRIHSGSPFEQKIGYCRAVVAGGFVHVAGTCAEGEDVVAQCKSALAIIENALNEAGSSMSDVVRVHYILPDRSEFEPCWDVLRAAFGENPPAATMFVADLIDPKFRIEIEVTAALR